MADDDRLRELEERYEGYNVYDNAGERIGKVDDLFVDEADREEYIGVKMGFFGLRSTLIPMEIARVNDRERTIEVAESKDHVKDAPTFDDDDDITPEFEGRIRSHFGLESLEISPERGTYGRYAGAATGAAGTVEAAPDRGDRPAGEGYSGVPTGGTEGRDRLDQESYREREDIGSRMEPAGATPSGGMADLETGARMEDEGYREGYRAGYREGFREGLREAGGGDRGDLESPGVARGTGPGEERMTRRGADEAGGIGAGDRDLERGGPEDRATDAARTGEETRERPSRSSDEGEREESGLSKVWRRLQR